MEGYVKLDLARGTVFLRPESVDYVQLDRNASCGPMMTVHTRGGHWFMVKGDAASVNGAICLLGLPEQPIAKGKE